MSARADGPQRAADARTVEDVFAEHFGEAVVDAEGYHYDIQQHPLDTVAALRAAVGGGPVVIMEDGTLYRAKRVDDWGDGEPSMVVAPVRPVVESSAAAPAYPSVDAMCSGFATVEGNCCARHERPAPAVPSTPEEPDEGPWVALGEAFRALPFTDEDEDVEVLLAAVADHGFSPVAAPARSSGAPTATPVVGEWYDEDGCSEHSDGVHRGRVCVCGREFVDLAAEGAPTCTDGSGLVYRGAIREDEPMHVPCPGGGPACGPTCGSGGTDA